jgi:hypothetical protein
MLHKSLKSNAGLARSPTQTVRSQSNPVFMAIYAVLKLTCLSTRSKTNPFASKLKLSSECCAGKKYHFFWHVRYRTYKLT